MYKHLQLIISIFRKNEFCFVMGFVLSVAEEVASFGVLSEQGTSLWEIDLKQTDAICLTFGVVLCVVLVKLN